MLDYAILQQKLSYQFIDASLLRLALTHRSYGSSNNERLEFLGDALLNATIAQALFEQFADEKEGNLSNLRACLVKGETLAEIAREFSISDYLILGDGERKSGGNRNSILADSIEAIIGAIFVDSDMESCQSFIRRVFKERLTGISVDKNLKDPKSRLQELLQSRKLPLPVYTIVDISGESHQQQFSVQCETGIIKESPVAYASSRRQAEKLAAEKVLLIFEQ